MASIIESIVHAIQNQIQSLNPVSLDKECEKATNIIKGFLLNDKLEVIKNSIMSPDAISKAKGLIFLTVGRVGVTFTVRGGSGIIMARLPDGTWSAPSAIKTTGFGLGSQLGAEISEIVMVLSTEEEVKNFLQMENITFGGSISAAIGNLGRIAEISSTIRNISSIISYGRCKGAFVGASVEGSVIQQNNEANLPVYGEGVTVENILTGKVPKPIFTNELYAVLHKCEEAGRAAAVAATAAANQKRNVTGRVSSEKQPLLQPVVIQVNNRDASTSYYSGQYRDEKRPH